MIPRHRRAAAATVLTLALSAPLLGATPAVSVNAAHLAPRVPYSSGLELPSPTGPYPVGRGTLHLVDRNRIDPWVPTAGSRELMVTVSYPARSVNGLLAAYMTDEEAQLLLEARGLGGVVPYETVSGARTHAHVGARPAPGHFPLVLLSPGFSMPRSTLTSIADDLASRGYVVASVDHAYESVGTAFPGGRMLTCVACERVETPQEQAAVVRGRVKDMSFVISELANGRRAGALSHVIDPSRIGIGGHSVGGAAAAATMAADRRVRAGVDLDGDFFVCPAAAGLGGRPFLMLGAESTHSPSSRKTDWLEAWKHLNGWKRWLTVAGAEHFSFTDLPYLAGQLGLSDPAVSLSGERGWRITRDYVSAFFDLHLRGISQPLLNGPKATHPEVAFQQP
ncbi:alpha/beta hydrolase family protein [Streptomyces sp. NPDC058642]|uniref:alpha/beta hydrolase family protein n=1 Tax=Streptomyces sp. NPDC058642 TaxID=3346572 RepID=UPI00364FBE13